jgi:hypothetical protein
MDSDYADRSNLKLLNGQILYELTKNFLYFSPYRWFNMGFCADVEGSRDYLLDKSHYLGEENCKTCFPFYRKAQGFALLQRKRISLGLLPNEEKELN